jgi:RNA polymerase sigma factor (sigma-70 family)
MIESAATLNDPSGGPLSPVDRLTRYFLEVRGELLQFFARRTGRTRAEDLVQDVWLRLRERSDPESWVEPRAVIFTVAANLATDAGRRAARDRARLSSDQSLMESVPTAMDPSVEAELANRVERVAAALAQLRPVYRDAFLLNRLESLTHAEIAELLGVSKKSVQRYLERAVLQILQASEE